jgi:hypothetical protein
MVNGRRQEAIIRRRNLTCGMLFCDLRTEVMSGPRRGDSMSQRKALREKPVRCGACSVGGLYRTAEMSTSSTGVIARGEEPFVFPHPVELDPPMYNQPINPPLPGFPRSTGVGPSEEQSSSRNQEEKKE